MHVADGTDPLMQAVADIIRTTLGPRAMLKMLLDASGGALRCCDCSTRDMLHQASSSPTTATQSCERLTCRTLLPRYADDDMTIKHRKSSPSRSSS